MAHVWTELQLNSDFIAWNSSDCFESFSPLNNWGSNNDSKSSDEIQASDFTDWIEIQHGGFKG